MARQREAPRWLAPPGAVTQGGKSLSASQPTSPFCPLCDDDFLPCPRCDNGRTTEAVARHAARLVAAADGDLSCLNERECAALAAFVVSGLATEEEEEAA